MITLVRHAQSTFNAFGDQTRDSPLSEYGHQSASGINGTYDLVICSTLRRARQTLDASSVVYSNLVFSELCREFRDSGGSVNMYSGEDSIADAETPDHFNERIKSFRSLLETYLQTYSKILVISHSIFLQQLCGHCFCNCETYEYRM